MGYQPKSPFPSKIKYPTFNSSMSTFSKRAACLVVTFQISALIAVSGAETVSPVQVTTFQANLGQMITRSRTVNLTIAATSSKGAVKYMQLGDSARGVFGAEQPYKKAISYSFPETATGRHFIAAIFKDSAGNKSNQANITLDIIPDLPYQPALVTGSNPGVSIRRGNYAFTQLADTVHDPGNPIVQFSTSLGEILIQLAPLKAPLTVANFLSYVDNNNYDNSFFHRSVPGFIIQGGGSFIDTANNYSVTPIESHGTVKNEPGDSNLRGTIATAKVDGDPDSATSEWFFNLADNSANLDQQNGGFTVFGKVLESSMPTVDGIAALSVSDQSASIGFNELPLIQVPSGDDTLKLQDLVLIGNASRFRFSVKKQVAGVKATIQNNYLVLEPSGKPTIANSSIMIRAIAPDGRYLDFAVPLDIATNHPMIAKGVGTQSIKINEDTPINISVPVSNPDNSPLVWDFTNLPTKGDCILLPEAKQGVRVIRYTPHANISGSDSFTLRVLDDDVNPQKRGQDQLKVNITITPINDLPTIIAPPTFEIAGGSTSSFDVEVADAETPANNLLVTCSASGSVFPSGSVTLQGAGATRKVQLSPSATTSISSGVVTLRVSDGSKKGTTTRVPVVVSP
jgi:cyclophilin family peptidyl-prolyl cis-trans isomerase